MPRTDDTDTTTRPTNRTPTDRTTAERTAETTASGQRPDRETDAPLVPMLNGPTTRPQPTMETLQRELSAVNRRLDRIEEYLQEETN
ncbi:hypothetical protein [Haloparvum sedimenti]|uniref:hypothetical protein n=1 Tax=Haloparvum sedimenti TaxID=1678448 RepID=UPI00071E6B41|nr:hypothetical protein [Haloparvum sedimenti]